MCNQAQVDMSSRSFKKVPAGAPQGYRTPSPPPVELISPASASNTRASSFIDNRYGVDYERKSKATLLGVYGNTGDDTESEDEVTGVPTKTNPLPAASIEGQVLAGNHAATIDALATIALATSPKYASKPDHIPHLGSFSPQRPLVRPSYAQAILPAQLLTYVGHHEIEERPSKRARSEAFTTSIQTAEQRPTTSYISNNLWSPVGSQTQWNHGGPSKLRDSAASDSMSNDAELLLNLARATTFSPETNTFRGFPLINGERHSPKTMPTRSQLPPEYGKDLKEPQMPLVSENEGPAASQRLTTEATVDESNFVETSGEQSRFQSIPFGEDENITRTGEEISAPCLPISNLDKDSMEVDSGNNSHNTPPSNVKVRPNHRGWPKGKPRGPRATWGGQKSVKNASGANGGSVSRPRRQTARRKETRNILQAAQSRGFDDTSPPARRRQVSLPPVLQQPSEPLMRRHSASEVSAAFDGRLWMQKFLKSSKAFSLGAQDNSSKSKSGSGGSGNTKRPKSLQSAVCTKCNFTRNTLLGDNDSNATSWISCDGCKSWFHFACAGFKSEREVRSVDKYICRDCRPKSGPTTCERQHSISFLHQS